MNISGVARNFPTSQFKRLVDFLSKYTLKTVVRNLIKIFDKLVNSLPDKPTSSSVQKKHPQLLPNVIKKR
jgi:hypothetical protein